MNLKSLSAHSVPLNYLVQRVREGSDEAFFRAVKIDPTIIQAPTLARRFSFAILNDEKRFMARYRAALKRDDPTKRRRPYGELRLAEMILRELGAFDTLSQRDIYEIVVNDLRLYGKPGSDSFKALFSLIDTWRKESTK